VVLAAVVILVVVVVVLALLPIGYKDDSLRARVSTL
jgi:hypothetical protein